jgi:transposase
MPHCNADTFQVFLNEFSACHADEFKIIVLDNGAFHKARALQIPQNISLLFLPPYSPELNPAEKIWHRLKRNFTNKLFKSLEELSLFMTHALKHLSNDTVRKTCSFQYIFSDLIWSN